MRGTEGGDVFYEENSKKAYKPPWVYTQVKEMQGQEGGKEQAFKSLYEIRNFSVGSSCK